MEDDECLFIDPNMENFHQILNPNPNPNQELDPLFLNFPSPFFDTNYPTYTNNYTHQNQLNSSNNPLNITDSPSESTRVKKRSVGKKDRHSKIHTAQGLRDRRMRLSLQIAQKFFHLQDLLGFDKASNTIEWLFCKSNKAIKEVAQNFTSQNTNQSMSEENYEVGLINELKTESNNHENSKEMQIKNTRSRNRIQNNFSVRETRDQARARARNRTRERLLIKELEKSKHLFDGNPNQESYKLGLVHKTSPNHHNKEELGFITSSSSELIRQESSSSGSIVGSSTYCSTLMNCNNPQEDWLNSCNGLLFNEWDHDSFVTDFFNYGIVPTTVSLTGDIYEQNPSSFLMSNTTINNLQL